jgi:hypothetical protein
VPHGSAWVRECEQPGSPSYTKILFADSREPIVFRKTTGLQMKKVDATRPIAATGDDF